MQGLSAGLTIYTYVLAAFLGLVFGSFLNCFAYRYAHGGSVVKGRSKCAFCGHTLAGKDLVPVFSYLFLKGKCRYCGKKLPFSYIAAELVCAAAYVSVLALFGISLATIKYLVFVSLLFAAAFTDFYCQIVPNRIIIIGILTAVIFNFVPFTAPFSGMLHGLFHTVLNGLSVSLPLLLLTLLFEKATKKEAMGGGDIKLLFMIGLYFNWKLNLLILIAACIFGIVFSLIFKKTGKPFAFGPAICAAAWLTLLFGQPIVNWYLSLFFG